jgi:reticulocyte-binding protein
LQEVVEKEEKFKYEQRERDLELYKNLFNTLTSKVSETVKLEIDARFQADMDNKSLAHTIAQRLMGEIDVLKRDIDKSVKETKESLKVNNNECSDRAHNLSKYIDQQVSGNNEGLLKKYDNIKTLISKLTDQFKAHIVFHDEQLKNLQNKVNSQVDASSLIKEELMNYTIGLEERYQKKFKDLTLYLEAIWKSNISAVNERVDLLSNKTDKNFVLLSQELVDTRKVLANRIDEIDTYQTLQFKTTVEDLEGILTKMKQYDILLEKFEKNNQILNKKVETNIADVISKVNTWQINDKVTKNIAHQELLGEVDKVRDELTHFSQQVEQNMQSMVKNFEATHLLLFEKSKQTVDQITKMSENNFKTFNQIDNNIETLQEESRRIEIGNLVNSMLNKLEEENIYNVIDSIKSDNINQSDHLKDKLEKIEDNIRNVELNTIVKEMIGKVELSLIGERLDNNSLNIEESEKMIFTRMDLIDTKIQIASNNIEDVRNELIQAKEDLSDNLAKKMDSKNNSDLENSIGNQIINHYESKILLDNMLNKIEFDNIYSILNSTSSTNKGTPNDISIKLESFNERLIKIDNEITETTATTKKVLNEYSSVIDSKVNNVMERLKKENLDMWTNSLKLENKTYTPDDIKKILKSIPPVIITREESKKMIKELETIVEKNPRPKLISPWEKIITYKQDFQYDVLNNLKDSGEEELKATIQKKKPKNMDNAKIFPKVNKQKNQETKENLSNKSGKNIESNRENQDQDLNKSKEEDNEDNKPKKEMNIKDQSGKELSLKKKNSEANLGKKKVEEEKKESNEDLNKENPKNNSENTQQQKEAPNKNEEKKNK